MAAAPSDASDAEAVFHVTSFFCTGGNLPGGISLNCRTAWRLTQSLRACSSMTGGLVCLHCAISAFQCMSASRSYLF